VATGRPCRSKPPSPVAPAVHPVGTTQALVQEVIAAADADMGEAAVPRITIHAFCARPETVALVEAASADRRMIRASTTARPGGLEAAVDYYQNQSTPSLVLVESLDAAPRMLALLDGLAQVCDPGTKVVVIGQTNDIALYRELMRRGVSEYITQPQGPLQIIRAVSSLYADPSAPFVGRQIAFVGAKGGVGSSTLAHNFAWSMAERVQAATVMVDLDLPFGTAGLDFNQDPLQGVLDALSQPDRLDPVLMDRMMVRCGDRLSLFAAPGTLDQDYEIPADAFEEVTQKIRGAAPFVVLDLPHSWSAWTRRVLIASDDLVVVATPDLASLRNAKNIVDLVRQARPNDAAAAPGAEPGGRARPSRDPGQGLRRGPGPDAVPGAALRSQALRPGRQQRPDGRRGGPQVEGGRGHRPPGAADQPPRTAGGPEDLGPLQPVQEEVGHVRQARSGRRPHGAGAAARLDRRAGHRHASAARRSRRQRLVAPAAPAAAPEAKAAGPKATNGLEQLRAAQGAPPTTNVVREQSDYYHATKTTIFNALLNTIDLSQLAQLDLKAAAEEIRDIVAELVAIKNVSMSVSEQEHLVQDIINDVLGYGPLEPLLARDDIADIMVNGAHRVFIEVGGKVQLTNVRFRDNLQLMNICQRIVSQVGRRVDESSPICDARLPDGSRVNVIAPPLALDGPTLTIRKFKKDKLTMKNLVDYASISPEGARVLGVIGACRCNIVISGGTGSGKTTLLNTMTAFIDPTERVVTCEDAAELQLQQPHVVRLETRPPNLEGQGAVTMRDLVKNCLRMRPERIIVGEVRGPEAFDLLQAMNTGHDGSMGTLHANSPREAISRIESMITMGGYGLPSKTIKEMIVGSVDVIVQAARLRDGSRRITHITEVVGLEGDVIVTQDLFVYEISGEDADGNGCSASTARPASAARASGTAPATTAWSASWPKPSTRRSRRHAVHPRRRPRLHHHRGPGLRAGRRRRRRLGQDRQARPADHRRRPPAVAARAKAAANTPTPAASRSSRP
jgi:pilus assembly protein CpaF